MTDHFAMGTVDLLSTFSAFHAIDDSQFSAEQKDNDKHYFFVFFFELSMELEPNQSIPTHIGF